MLKKFLAIIISVISIYMPCTTNFCLAKSCQIDNIDVKLNDANSCNEYDVIHYLSRKWIDAMCKEESKLSKFFKHPATMPTITAVVGLVGSLGLAIVQGVAAVAKDKKDHKKGSFGSPYFDFKGYCNQILEISNNNKKCGAIVKYHKFVKDVNTVLFSSIEIDPQTE